MLIHLFLVMITALPAEAGQVVTASSELLLLRGTDTFSASSGAMILTGDRLVAGGSGNTRILLDDGHVIALAPGTMTAIQGSSDARSIALESGEVRVTAGGAGSLLVEFGQARVEVRRGIIRAASDGGRLKVERGSAAVTMPNRASILVEEGREISTNPNGRPILVSTAASAWTLPGSDLGSITPANDARALLAMQNPKPATPSVKPAVPANPIKPKTPKPEEIKPKPPVPPNPNPTPGPEDPPLPPAEAAEATRGGPLALPEDTTRAAGDQTNNGDDPNNPANRPYQPVAVAQPASTSSISLALGNISASSSAASSGALFSDAQQDSINLSFPGNVHLVTGQTSYVLYNVNLIAKDLFPANNQLWSVGVGALPQTQVSTNVGSGTGLNPAVIRIPHTRDYLVRFDQVRFKDQTTNSSTNSSFNALGITGFTGTNPTSPQIYGAMPLTDRSAILNNRLTFALGEFGLSTAGNHPVLNVRSSDQDRKIIFGKNSDYQNDKIYPNPNVNFTAVHDAKFFPNLQTVQVPVDNTAQLPTLKHTPTYAGLMLIQKAAATTLLAQALYPYTQRTGQYRYVINGRIVDVSGYRPTTIPPSPPVQTAITHAPSTQALLRSGHAAPGMAGGHVKAVHQHVARGHHGSK